MARTVDMRNSRGWEGQLGRRLVFSKCPQGWSMEQSWGARKHKPRLKEGDTAGGKTKW